MRAPLRSPPPEARPGPGAVRRGASCWWTSRWASARTPRSRRQAGAGRGQGRTRGHARSVRERPVDRPGGGRQRLQRRMMELRKRYETVALLGALSSTGDPEGADHRSRAGCRPSPPALLPGEIRQRPPRYSAVKIGGRARLPPRGRGESFEMPERIVRSTLRAALARVDGERAGYEIECSSGTYVRSLIADLGDAYCLELRRTAIGPFSVKRAIAPPAAGRGWRPRSCSRCERALAPCRADRAGTRGARTKTSLGFARSGVIRLPTCRPEASPRPGARGRRDVRRRAPRSSRGDRRRGQRGHVRAPPRVGGGAGHTPKLLTTSK